MQTEKKGPLTEKAIVFLLDKYLYGRDTVTRFLIDERGDVPGWVFVVLMTTGLVTGIWTLAAPRIQSILRNSLDSMNGIQG
jgi:hypothetical protein